MVDVMKIPVDIINFVFEYLKEVEMTCGHCGFVGSSDWFVVDDDKCEECQAYIEGNGSELE